MATKLLKITTALDNPTSSGTLTDVAVVLGGNTYINWGRQQECNSQIEVAYYTNEACYDDTAKDQVRGFVYNSVALANSVSQLIAEADADADLREALYDAVKAYLEGLGLTVVKVAKA